MLVFLLALHLLDTLCTVKCLDIHTDSECTVLVLKDCLFLLRSQRQRNVLKSAPNLRVKKIWCPDPILVLN